jgi:hypothetical protein
MSRMCIIIEGVFHTPIVEKRVGKSSIIVKNMLDGALVPEEGTRDNIIDGSHGNGISMVCRCGQKPSGEEVSISFRLGSRTTDRPDTLYRICCCFP